MAIIKIGDTSFAEIARPDVLDKVTIEVGDSKQDDFHPQIKLMRWDNEINFSARLIHSEGRIN